MKKLQLFPALDIVNGQAVRLVKGVAGTEHSYGHPMQAVENFVNAGARWLHLVDLDAAFGRGSNLELITQIVKEFPELQVEVGGGIRDAKKLEKVLANGVARVNLGTIALENPEFTAQVIAEYGDKIAVGLDVRGETLAGHGWTSDGGNLWEVLARLDAAGCARYVLTDTQKDGTLQGPNVDLLRKVCARTDRPIIASGGVSTLDDLCILRELTSYGVEGAIVGKALYAHAFTLEQALAVAES